jgi:hypothetical protein
VGAVLSCALPVIGCGSDPKPAMHCPIGDVSLPAEIQIVHQDASSSVIETQPMAEVPLIAPPQGGWIVLLGVRAKNIDGCQAMLTTALVDACDSQIIQIDRRPTHLDMGADGWGQSSINMFGNLPVCPQITATRDLYNVPYIVKVSVEDADGQKASASLTVVPTCPTDASSRCPCECDRDYVVGNQCPTVVTPHGTCSPN